MQNANWETWLVNESTWERGNFLREVSDYLESVGEDKIDRYAIGLLVNEIETYITCTRVILKDGLVVTHRNGVLGRNLHLAIRDRALSSAMSILSELGLTPRRRKARRPEPDKALAQFLLGPKYVSLDSSQSRKDSHEIL